MTFCQDRDNLFLASPAYQQNTFLQICTLYLAFQVVMFLTCTYNDELAPKLRKSRLSECLNQ